MSPTDTSAIGREGSVAELEILLSGAPGLLCAHDLSGVLLMVNEGATRMLGYGRDEMIGRNLRDFIAEPYREECEASLMGVDQGRPVSAFLRLVRRDGHSIAVAYQSLRVTQPGVPPFVVVHGLDLTERIEAKLAAAARPPLSLKSDRISKLVTMPLRKPGDGAERTDQQIRVSERRLRHVVEHVREVFFETDTAGRWVYLNPAWTVMTGYTVEESLRKPFSDFVWGDDVDMSLARFNPLIAREREYSRHEIRYRTKSGGFRWIEVHMQVVHEDGERVIGTSGTLRDVTAQRDLSEQLVRAREAAITASRAKSDFLANMSHEIRTPMNGVIGLTDLLLDTALSTEQREYADGVKQSAEALLTIINDILDFSKIEAGKLSINPVSHDLHQAIREAVNLVDVKARNKGLRVSLDLRSDVPREVTGDPVRIRQVLINLIDNAVKFTYSGGVAVSVSTEPQTDGGLTVRFAIADTGIGIERDKLDLIFDKFTQADASTTRRFGGSGLGLAICQQLVGLMSGEIGVESEIAKGSTFWFRLPLVRVEANAGPEAPRAESPKRQGTAAARERALRVLVAEDSVINLKVACRTLQKLGCEVDVAENGAVAVEMVRRTGYDVVFMDCQMPVLDGYEATASIRRLPERGATKIVAMTAHALPADRERCLAAGMDDYLSKPISVLEIRRVLASLDGSEPAPADARPVSQPASFDGVELWSRMDGDKQAIADLVELLAADGPAYVLSLNAAIAAGDLTAAIFVAHTLKGSVGNFAAKRAAELAKRVEAAARVGDLAETRDAARPLESEVVRLIADLRDWLRSMGDSKKGP